eukprot:260864_1
MHLLSLMLSYNKMLTKTHPFQSNEKRTTWKTSSIFILTTMATHICCAKESQKQLSRCNQNKKIFKSEQSIAKESYNMLKLSFQISLSMIFEVCIVTITAIFLGHLKGSNSSQILSATSIASSFINIICCSIAWGFTSALWTLVPQAVGSGNTHLITLYIQRGFVVCTAIAIPLSVCMLYSKNILVFIGINSDNDIDWNIISNYCIASITYVFPLVWLAILHRITQNLYYNFEIFVIQGIMFLLTIPLSYLFMITFNVGYLGAAAVRTIVMIGNVILITLLLIYKGYGYLFKPLSISQICDRNGLYQYLQIAFPGCIQGWLNWGVSALRTLLVGYVTNSAVAGACAAVMSHVCLLSLSQNGIANAFTIRIGNYIGANEIGYAKRCIKIQICFASILMLIVSVICIVFKRGIAAMFTSNKQVIDLIADTFIYVCVLDMFVLFIHRNIIGVYRALGFQKLSAYVGIVTQYLIALPLQLYLLFSYKYVDNMEMAICIIFMVTSLVGRLLAALILIYVLIFYIDWNKAVQESQSRIELNNQQFRDRSHATNALLKHVDSETQIKCDRVISVSRNV